MHGNPGLQRAQDNEQHCQLAHADQKPFGPGERFFDEFTQAEVEHQRLDDGFEQPSLDGGEQIGKCLNHVHHDDCFNVCYLMTAVCCVSSAAR